MLKSCGDNLCYRWLPFMIKIIGTIISLDSCEMIKAKASGTLSDDRKQRKRQTVVEAVNYDPKTRACLAVAAYGEQTDWYRNLQAHPALEVQIGRQRYIPHQRFLSPEELLALLQDYQRRHPRGLALLLRAIGYPYNGTSEGLRLVAQVLRGVEFRSQAGQDR
jgi:deazaflavin-dependent oxidoreductase (nitroreductase family)